MPYDPLTQSIHFPGNCWWRKAFTGLAWCGGTSSTETMRVHLPARHSPSTLCQSSGTLSRSAVSRQTDWERGSYSMATQVTKFDPFRYISVRVHEGLGVPNKGARCGWTASQNNCSLWGCYTSDAAKHLVRDEVWSGHLSGYQGRKSGDLLRNIKTRKVTASFSAVSMFLSILV
jgi:hypothetical protein